MKFLLLITNVFFLSTLNAHEIKSASDKKVNAPFDIVKTRITSNDNVVTFEMETTKEAGKLKPTKKGKLAGSAVFSYVWPTSINPSEVGFEKDTGILAFAVTAHPDFDDTPLFDENTDGKLNNDGNVWHSHWVVLTPDEACGPKGLKVRDIPAGQKPKLPVTWPGLPLFIDSPGYSPLFSKNTVKVNVPFNDVSAIKNSKFDGVTAGLRVHESVHAPLLCVENVFKIASKDLSLPGVIE